MNANDIASDVAPAAVPQDRDDGYAAFEALVRARAAAAKYPLFTTDAEGLFEAYLAGIPAASRQHYNCRSCRKFVENYGGLVRLDGVTQIPLLWDTLGVPPFFVESSRDMWNLVARASVTGVFYSSDAVWGTPRSEKGGWTHLSAVNPSVFKKATQTAFQQAAEKKEDYKTLKVALADFTIETIREAHRVLASEHLTRSEKTVGPATWLLELQTALCNTRNEVARHRLLWSAVATAPAGFCHVRSTMIGTLLEDIVARKPFEEICRAWRAKVHPARYQRPQAPPSDGTIAQANKVIEQLQAAGSLARRYARLEELTAIWKPQPPAPPTPAGSGTFDHLRAVPPPPVRTIDLPETVMTWTKFAAKVLPDAIAMEVYIRHVRQNFVGFVTAVNPDAPPILQWDGLKSANVQGGASGTAWEAADLPRNPVSWYVIINGSYPEDWSMKAGWAVVNAATLSPSHWQRPDLFAHQGESFSLILEGCRPKKAANLALFPEILKAELHGIRSVLEAHSKSGTLAGLEDATACGLVFKRPGAAALFDPPSLRVTDRRGNLAVYKIDRWD